MAWFSSDFSSPGDERKFTVYMNEGERDQIYKWVERYQNIETGGDLFGAWIDDRTAVVQFVLGPGKDCRRTSVSFYQDIEYLRNAGSYLTQKHGLCNIGQWHSHHRLGLTRPSGGDENTVWGNMPNLGLDRYIVIIATITGGSHWSYSDFPKDPVNINPYLFEIKNGRKSGVLHGSFEFLEQNSPFRVDESIQNKVKTGAETTNEVTNYAKRPHEIENGESAITKIPKTEAKDQNIWNDDEVSEHSDIEEGEVTEKGPEEDATQDEDRRLNIPQNDDEVRAQADIGEGSESTKKDSEEASTRDAQSGQFETARVGVTEENIEDAPSEDKESEQANISQGKAIEEGPDEVPPSEEESGQPNIPQEDDTKENPEDIQNENKGSEQANISQEDDTKENSEDVQNENKESEQPNISQEDDTKENSEDVQNENKESEQANVGKGDAIEKDPEEEPSQDQNAAQGNGTKETPGGAPSEDKENGMANTPQEESTTRNQDIRTEDEVNEQSKIEQGGATEKDSVVTEDDESKDSCIPQGNDIDGDLQQSGSESNLQAEVDFNEKSEATPSTSNTDTEMMDVDEAQLPTSSIQKNEEEESLSKHPEGENKHNDESQKRNDNGVTECVPEIVLHDGGGNQFNAAKADDTEENPQEDGPVRDFPNVLNKDEVNIELEECTEKILEDVHKEMMGVDDTQSPTSNVQKDDTEESLPKNSEANLYNDAQDQDDAVSNATQPADGPDEVCGKSVENLTSSISDERTDDSYFLGEQNEQPTEKSDKQPKSLDWGEKDNVLKDSHSDRQMEGNDDNKSNEKTSNSGRVRSIFDPIVQETEKQTLTSNDETHEADTKAGRQAEADSSEENETNEQKNWQDNKPVLSNPQRESLTFMQCLTEMENDDIMHNVDTEVETEAVVHAIEENETNNQQKDLKDNKPDLSDPRPEELDKIKIMSEENKKVVESQNTDDEKVKPRCLPCRFHIKSGKKKPKSKGGNGDGGKKTKKQKRKSRKENEVNIEDGDVQPDDMNTVKNSVDPATNKKESKSTEKEDAEVSGVNESTENTKMAKKRDKKKKKSKEKTKNLKGEKERQDEKKKH